jgi:tetratricopeptide (TPR) repeat protein
VEPENLQNNAWPPQNVVHAIKVDEVPVCVVIKRKNKDDIAAYKALEANDFAKSAALYESNLKADASNEYIWFYYSVALAQLGRMDEAIVAIQNAIQLNGSNPDWVEQYSKYNQIKNQMGRN